MLRPVLKWTRSTSARKLILRPPTTLLQTALTRAQPATTRNRAPHTRHFHQTPAHRLFETPDQVVAAVAGVAVGWLIVRSLPRIIGRLGGFKVINLSNAVPLTWLTQADPQTRDGVLSAITAGFALARSRPTSSQNDALREVTFQLPHEIARLNKDAPQFMNQDMGPCPDFTDEVLKVVATTLDGFKPTFDTQKDTRVFLYYPSGAHKATAAFLVINTDMTVPDPHKHHIIKHPLSSANTQSKHNDSHTELSFRENHALVQYAMNLWINTYGTWMTKSPEIIKDNIEPGALPVIFCFRDKTCGSPYSQETQLFPAALSAALIVGLIQKD